MIFHVGKANASIPRLLSKFLYNKDVKIVEIGMKKPLQKPRDECNFEVSHAVDLEILAAENFLKPDLRKARINELVMKLIGEQLLTQRKMKSR